MNNEKVTIPRLRSPHLPPSSSFLLLLLLVYVIIGSLSFPFIKKESGSHFCNSPRFYIFFFPCPCPFLLNPSLSCLSFSFPFTFPLYSLTHSTHPTPSCSPIPLIFSDPSPYALFRFTHHSS